jgi:hypothetical protein
MLRIKDQSNKVPTIQRQRVSVTDVRDMVERQLIDAEVPASIDVLWDGADDPKLSVFADPALICQMIVHFVTKSIDVTPAGGCVLIRLQAAPNRDFVRWSVIDQGPGVSENEIQEMLAAQGGKSAEFGVANCQVIAALHCSTLDLYSRVGSGTEISFNTPHSGPRNVAAVWSDWRMEQAVNAHSNPEIEGESNSKWRIDSSPARICLSQSIAQPLCGDQMSAGTVTLGATVSRLSADQFDQFLQSELQMFDLVYRVGTRRWAWVFDNDFESAEQRIESLIARSGTAIPGIRMNWSQPLMIPIDNRLTNSRLSDLLIRETLSESTPAGLVDKDTVRMGTAPIEPSPQASARLEAELRRLSGRLKSQTSRLQRQSRQLRPLS